jgi:hypothetical protein
VILLEISDLARLMVDEYTELRYGDSTSLDECLASASNVAFKPDKLGTSIRPSPGGAEMPSDTYRFASVYPRKEAPTLLGRE